MRHKIGATFRPFHRITTGLAGVAAATPTGKPDPTISFVNVDTGSDPLDVVISIPPYDPATFNALLAVTAIAVPVGSGKPSDAAGWLASSYPKASLSATAAAPAQAQAQAQAQPQPQAAAPAAAPAAAVATQAAPAATATATAPTPAATAAPAAPTAAATLPAPQAGGQVTLAIPGVPNGNFEIVLIESYDS